MSALRAAPLRSAAVRPRVSSRKAVVPKAELNSMMVISASTAGMLALGRFAFLGQQRRESNYDSKIGPKTTGTTFFDDLQKDTTIFATNDPAGFNIIDVAGWGALGHVVGYTILAVNSLQA